MRAHGEAGRRRVRDRRAGLHAEPDPRRRALRRAARARSPRAPTSTRSTSRIRAGCCRRKRAAHADSRRSRRVIGATSRSSCTRTAPSGSPSMTYLDAAATRRERAAVRLGRRRGRHLESARRSASSPTCARSGTPCASTTRRWPRCRNYFTQLAEAEGLPSRAGRRASTPPTCATSCRAAWWAPCAGTWPRARVVAPGGRGDRGAGPRARGARLADRDDAVRADA